MEGVLRSNVCVCGGGEGWPRARAMGSGVLCNEVQCIMSNSLGTPMHRVTKRHE